MRFNQNNPKIAVLLAAHNGICWLQSQLDSILNQQGVDVTIFVSVDKSNDGTEKWFDQLAVKDTRVEILPHGNYFGSAAPNFFRLIRDVDFQLFDYVSLSDQDDIWYLDKLKRAVNQLSQQGADAYSSNVLAFWPCGKKRLIQKSYTQQQWDYLFEAAGPGCTYVINKKLMLAIKNCVRLHSRDIQSINLHDWFCYAYARAHNYLWYIDPQPYVLYRQHNENQVGANNGLRAFAYRFNIISTGGGIKQSVLIAKIVGLNDADFVTLWSGLKRTGFLRLAFLTGKCRRKNMDKIIFFLACLLMAFLGVQ